MIICVDGSNSQARRACLSLRSFWLCWQCHFLTFWIAIILQCPGFIIAASIWGIHAGGIFFGLVMGSVNAAVYGLIAFGLFSLGGRPNRAD